MNNKAIENTNILDNNKDISKKNSQITEVLKRLKKDKAAVIGLIILVSLIIITLFSGLFLDYETDVIAQNIPDRLQPPSREHLLGTDEFGRDMLARIVYGAKYSLGISFLAVTFGLTTGGTIGIIAGYYGNKVDNFLMRIMDILLAMPMMLFAMVIVAALGPNTINLVIALSISLVPTFARVVRGAVLTVKDNEYIEASRAIGASDLTIIISHILPNCMAPIIVQTTLRIATTITNTAAISFLGLGVQQPIPEWGGLLSAGRSFIRDNSYLTLYPGMAIMITVLSLNLLGDGLRDVLDPRLK